MEIKYDPDVDAVYISLKKGPTPVSTIRLNEDIAIDLGTGEKIVGIEILDASVNLGFKKEKAKIKLKNLNVAWLIKWMKVN